MDTNTRETTRKDRERICCAFAFVCVIGKNLKTPKLSPMADDAITRGGIGGLGSLVYIYGGPTDFVLKRFHCIHELT